MAGRSSDSSDCSGCFSAGGFDAIKLLISLEEGAPQAALDLRQTIEDGGAGAGGRPAAKHSASRISARTSFHWAMAAWSTRYCSAGVWGRYWFWRPAWIWSNSSGSSSGSTTVRARSPLRSALNKRNRMAAALATHGDENRGGWR